ncbi:hypothetical protein OR62_03215 [Clostridium tetani]|uniref:BRO-N domain-containing protein n=1 Tax=Clostridium tetani TaxID=1513 RepID=UPI000574261B|nr:BRO family protein [Clostridium tetani]KHO39943.1 hypothetical protein OR62_03215 [Clostridium tetani]
MNNLQIFNNKDFGEVRILVKNNKEYFAGSDIAKALGYAIPSKAINTHCKGVSKMEVPTKGGMQEMLFITEGDIYRLIIKSKLPQAEKFERWVFDQVLPSVRKHGEYVTEIKAQQKLFNIMKAEVTTLIDEIVSDKILEIEQKCSEYYRPSSSQKYDISQYIKKRLGIGKADEEYELVKQRVLIKLNATKWEDIPVEVLRDSLNIIDESIRVIKADRQTNQVSFFEIACN